MARSNSFVNLLTSQGSIDLGSSEPPFFTGKSSEVPMVKERRKWSMKEDLILIGACLNTSKDPIVSNEQKGHAFWKRIVELYNSSPQLVGIIPRELGSCKQRWQRINEGVCRFAGCYDMALREQRSGHNDNDVMKKALDIFANDQGSKFNFEHAWRELRHDVKWCSTFLEKEKRKPADSQADGEGAVPDPEPEERPIWVKAAKKRKKNEKEEELGKLQNLMKLKKQISQQSLLESLLANPEPLSEMESAPKLKLMSELL